MQAASLQLLLEGDDDGKMISQEHLHSLGRAVSQMQPNHFRRVAQEEAAVAEVRVFGNDREAVRLCVIPNHHVIRFVQAEKEDMDRVREEIHQPPNQVRRQIVVKKQLHAPGLGSFLERGGVSEASLDVLAGQIRKVAKDFLHAHAGRKVLQNILHRDPHASNAGVTAALARLDGDVLSIVEFHGANIRNKGPVVNGDNPAAPDPTLAWTTSSRSMSGAKRGCVLRTNRSNVASRSGLGIARS